MMRFSRRLFRYILLVSVFLNLGDAPYLDEIFGEFEQQPQSVMASKPDGNDPASPKPAGAPKSACCGYQLLLNLHGIAAERLTLPVASAAREFSSQEFLLLDSAPLDRIDRPPRSRLSA